MKNVCTGISIAKLNDLDLRDATLRISAQERKITADVINHLLEVERRKLHLTWGYPSLFEYAVKELKYSESAAYRRIQAARTLKQVPEVAASLKSGDLKLTQVAKMQTVIKQSEKLSGEKVSLLAQKDLLQKLVGKNTQETEQILEQNLLLVNGRDFPPMEASFEKHCGDGAIELTLKISKETYQQLQQVRDLYSHKDPFANWVDILKMMMADVIKKRDLTSQQTPKPKITQSNTVAEVAPCGLKQKRKSIPVQIKRMVRQKSKGRCEFKSEDGRICGSSFLIEIDHIHPVSLGGGNEIKNLRTLCRNHNQNVYIKLHPTTDPNRSMAQTEI